MSKLKTGNDLLEARDTICDLCVEGLQMDGEHHKQWYLEQILTALGVDLDKAVDEDGRSFYWEPGIAP